MRLRRILITGALAGTGLLAGFAPPYLWHLHRLIGDDLSAGTGAVRLYARPYTASVESTVSHERLRFELSSAGYRSGSGPGSYADQGGSIVIHTRPQDEPPATRVSFADDGNGLHPARKVRFAPVEIGQLPPGSASSIHVPLESTPALLIAALQAVEDRRFAAHFGVDLVGLVRAGWANLRAGRVVQGGSTLTQQLVKNRFLTSEQTLWRKFNEAIMAAMIEARFTKREILQAYLDGVYLGQRGNSEIRGFGRAALHYFGQPLPTLDGHQVALLVALLKGPSYYNPWRHPRRALERRNLVLRELYATGQIPRSSMRAWQQRSLDVLPREPSADTRRYPAFIDLAGRQLRRSGQAGPAVATSLSPWHQHQAEAALAETVGAIGLDGLQGALVVVDRARGEILAAVGGVPVDYPGFNRVADAHRQIGSLIKPFVYLAALNRGGRTLADPVDDSPVTVTLEDGTRWQPQNFDRRSAGRVPLIRALVESRNQATVHLGLELGLNALAETLRDLGWQGEAPRHPSALLGALEMSPLEVAQLYLSLSRGGLVPISALRAARSGLVAGTGRYGADSFLVKYALSRAVDEGTGRSVAPDRAEALAGKTGTTNDGRDAWFAGFTRNLVVVAWVGRDDAESADLSGARAAGRVVAAFLDRVSWEPIETRPPEGVRFAWVETATGRRVSAGCPGVDYLPFVESRMPPKSEQCAGRDN